jgi:hypothetical protein
MQPDIPKKPPGRRLVKRMPLRTKWLITLSAGLILLALGLYVMSSAVAMRTNPSENAIRSFLMTVYAITIICIAVYVFGQSVRFHVLMDLNRRLNKHERDTEKIIKKNLRKITKPRQQDANEA